MLVVFSFSHFLFLAATCVLKVELAVASFHGAEPLSLAMLASPGTAFMTDKPHPPLDDPAVDRMGRVVVVVMVVVITVILGVVVQ